MTGSNNTAATAEHPFVRDTSDEVPGSSRSNVLALVAFILSFVLTVPAIVCGHIALRQLSRSGGHGRGFAIAALVLGYSLTLVYLLIGLVAVPLAILSLLDSYSY